MIFWGGFAFILGVFHTAMGMLVTSIAVADAGPIVPEAHPLVATGVGVAVAALAYGSLVLLASALAWGGLHQLHRRPS